MRGEDCILYNFFVLKPETPPRAWGRFRKDKVAGKLERNTPTCVGKIYYQLTDIDYRKKHPHVRGEDSL